MANLKPSWFTAQILNRIAMATGLTDAETLTLTARSEQTQRIPVIQRRGRRGPLSGVHPRGVIVG